MGTAPRMTVAENLLIAKDRGQKRPFSPRHIQAHKEEFLNLLTRTGNGLDQHLETPTGLLSGGQRQALSLLMATLKRPELLLLDEHTVALDPKTSVSLMQLTDEFVREDPLTALMIIHHMEDAPQTRQPPHRYEEWQNRQRPQPGRKIPNADCRLLSVF